MKLTVSTNQSIYLGRIIVIFLICLLTYFNTLKVPFQFDGVVHIQQNHWIKSFSTFHKEFRITNLWNRSILVFTYTVNYYLGKENTFGYHLFNLFLHFGVCIFIYLIARKILIHSYLAGRVKPAHRLNIPFVSAVLFAVHPVHTQTVTYLMSRAALLSTFFCLGSFYCFMTVVENRFLTSIPGRGKLYCVGLTGLALILMVLGYGSKLIAITLPLMMLVYYFMFSRTESENFWQFIRKEIKLLALIALPFITFIVYKSFFTSGLLRIPDPGYANHSKLTYFFTEIKMGIFFYLKILFFPVNLNTDPDIGLITTFADPLIYLSALILVVFFLFIKNQTRLALFGFLWFIITISPESTIVPLSDVVAEHRMYLPGVGFIIMVSGLLTHRRLLPFYLPLFILFSINSIHRNSDWFSEKTLWRDVVKKSPNKARSFINYARALYFEGEIELAIKNYKRAIELDPYYFEPHHNLAEAYVRVGKCPDAIKEFEYALLLVPELVESMVGLGKCHKKLGDYDKATAYFTKALEIRPSYDNAFLELGLLHYFELSEKKKGRFYFKQALRLNPNLPSRDLIVRLLNE